jgi:hypothetical protein
LRLSLAAAPATNASRAHASTGAGGGHGPRHDPVALARRARTTAWSVGRSGGGAAGSLDDDQWSGGRTRAKRPLASERSSGPDGALIGLAVGRIFEASPGLVDRVGARSGARQCLVERSSVPGRALVDAWSALVGASSGAARIQVRPRP